MTLRSIAADLMTLVAVGLFVAGIVTVWGARRP